MYNAEEKGVPKKCHLGVNASKSKIKIIRNMISATENFTRNRKFDNIQSHFRFRKNIKKGKNKAHRLNYLMD